MGSEASENLQKLKDTEPANPKRIRFPLTHHEWYIEPGGEPLDITTIRSHLAEFIGVKILYAVQTSRYPPGILDNEIFSIMDEKERDFLKKNWHTFDLFKPKFHIGINGTFSYSGLFKLYEVKSKIIRENNMHELANPTFIFSLNQKKFFDEAAERGILIKILAVFFLPDWNVEIAQFDYSEVKKEYSSPDPAHEEKMKRIKASPFARFFNELFPDMVLEKINENELDKRYDQEAYEFASMMAKNPDERHKKILEERQERMINIKRKKHDFKGKVVRGSYDSNLLPAGKSWRREEGPLPRWVVRDSKVPKPPRAGRPWNKEEEDALRREFAIGKNVREISDNHQRNPGGIIKRLRKLRIITISKAMEIYHEVHADDK